MELTYVENIDKIGINFFSIRKNRFTLSRGIHEKCDINKTLEFFLPNVVKKNITFDDTRLRSN